MKTKLLFCTLLVASSLCSVAAEKYDLLAVHKTKATYTGTKDHRCLGKTSLCPDQCGESGSLAVFKIDEYTAYEKKGQYGDEKQTTFQFLTVNTLKQTKASADLVAKIETLKPGDKVVLEWEHRYMDRDGSRWPERPVTKLEKIP